MPHLSARVRAQIRARPRLVAAATTGAAAALLLPSSLSLTSRGLLGWNVAVWLYLLLAGLMMMRADHHRLRRAAVAHAEGAATVLGVVSLAAVVSLLAVVAELSAAKQPGAPHALSHVALGLATVTGSWLLLPITFALTYASAYYRSDTGSGLQFPGAGADFRPGYADFLYFAFTIAVAAQTSDVAVTTSPLRRIVLLQALLSFAFNTAVLAFTINIAASLF